MKTSGLTSRQICSLYDAGHPTLQIAERAGLSAAGVRYHLRRNNITMRPRGSAPYKRSASRYSKPRKERRISISQMRDRYQAQGQSLQQIAKVAGVSTFTARKDLLGAGVKMRSKGGKMRLKVGKRSSSTLKISLAAKHHDAVMVLVNALGGKQV